MSAVATVSGVDDLILRIRRLAGRESVQVRVSYLNMLADEILRLRAMVARSLPTQDGTGAFHSHAPDTEKQAAYAIFPKSGKQRFRVLLMIAGSDGMTDAEVADKTGIYLYSAAPRRNELLLGGWVEDSGHRRLTGNGGEGIVWQITDKARVALRERGWAV